MIVETTGGSILGHKRWGVARFAGIPYAAPPVDEHRFRPPRPHPGWFGVRDTRAVGPMAAQHLHAPTRVPMSEDCLYLNVYSPALDGERRPVLVWVHGGGFLSGAASDVVYDGTLHARERDVVIVTLNYRLGVLGWLHLDHLDDGEPGSANHGLLDVLEALRWIKQNIVAFGGDPDNVTLWGQSSGAMAAAALMAHPCAGDLFHKVIAQSGGPLHTKTAEAAADVTDRFLAAMGTRSVDTLRSAPLDALLDAQAQTVTTLDHDWLTHPWPDRFLAFGPVVDGAVVRQPPLDAIATGSAADVALLVGTIGREWRTFGGEGWEEWLRQGLRAAAPEADRIIAAYAEHFDDSGLMWGAVMTDLIFRVPTLRFAEAQQRHAPVFVYQFNWERGGDFPRPGFHSMELPFVFDTVLRPNVDIVMGPDVPVELSKEVSSAWTNFARTGRPVTDGLATWPPYGPERLTALIDAEWSVVDDPDAERRALWEGVL